jgi:protocatechuate 3,4-dioxygenase beta subunit
VENDDAMQGRVLGRREVLALVGAAGLGAMTKTLGAQAGVRGDIPSSAMIPVPNCVVRPQQTEGPYFVDGTMERVDIRTEPGGHDAVAGAPLEMAFRVSRIGRGTCTPLGGATVELWQCDALGVYSGVRDMNGRFDTRDKRFLRGHQITDAAGHARFTTIFPGWYEGRAVHLHMKISALNAAGTRMFFTSQIYFDDAVVAQVLARAPYAQKGTAQWLRNAQDGIFRRGGDQLVVATRPQGDGYAGIFEIGMEL